MLIAAGAAFIALLLLGVPVGFILLALSAIYVLAEPAIMDLAFAQRLMNGTQSFPLLAIPLFILTGELMNASGITRRVMRFATRLTGRFTGGLAKANVVLSTLLAGMSGSANGDAAMQAKVLVPEMTRRGYPPAFSAAVTAASALIAPMIPPGIGLILFGFVTDTSIGALFVAAIVPGLVLSLGLLALTHGIARRRGYDPPRPSAEVRADGGSLLDALPAILLPILIVVGIRGGAFTPSEAAAMAVAYTAVFLLVYREADWRTIGRALRQTVVTTASILLVLAASAAFSWILAFEQVPQAVAGALAAATAQPTLMLMIIAAVLFATGIFIEGTAVILILGPMFMPAVTALGIDPVHYGVVFVLMVHLGGITPPVGTVMFTTCSVAGVRLLDFARAVIPFILCYLAVALLIILVPALSTGLAQL